MTARLICSLVVAVFAGALFSAATHAQREDRVTVYAAASLKEALDELARRFEAQGGGRVVVSYGGSAMLARQIEKGAPAELFISADLEWMDYLAARRLIRAESRGNLLSNRLVLVAPAGSKTTLAVNPKFPLAAALGNGRLALADPDHVPAGKYARAALDALEVWNDVAARLARAENVRAALALVARGEAPLGIVYRTDARAEPRVRVVAEFPETLHPPIIYPAALVAGERSQAGAQAFLRYLRSPSARGVWERHGFGTGG
jgi:molybdate transport system substrate-binding protein